MADICQEGAPLATYGQVVATWLRKAMEAAGRKSKVALAKDSGVERSTIYEILSGDANPSPATIAQLAKAMRVPGPDFRLAAAGDPTDAVGWIREAQAALDQAVAFALEQTGKAAADGGAGAELPSDATSVEQSGKRPAAPGPRQPRKSGEPPED
jgi:DNA-binding phage protein